MQFFKTPTQQQIDTAVQRMRSPEFAAYFFSRLENPNWVAVLNENGLFMVPPPPVYVEGGGVSFPHWPASKYLARMAKHVPSEVALIFSKLETDNLSVLRDVLDVAKAMPADIAATLVPLFCRHKPWEIFDFILEDASDLCAHLADGGEASAAMTLAGALFEPTFEEGQEEPRRRDAYWYKEGLEKVIPALADREPHKFLSKLCDWLKISIDAKKHIDPSSGLDYSYLWRPAIEEHEQNKDYEFSGIIVGLVRQGFEKAIQDGALSLEAALDILSHYSYGVFKRLGIHLINEFADKNPGLARQTIMDRELFEDHYYKHEYAMLVGRRLDLLTTEERDAWFRWVDAGPDMSKFNQFFKESFGRDATEEDRQGRIQYWQFEKLHCVRSHLQGERRKFYDQMLMKHGEPELADLNSRTVVGWRGPSSPMTVEELAKQTFEQVLELISSWKPKEQHRFEGPDIEGLASTFGQYIATDPEGFSKRASLLFGRPPIYVRTFIGQMAEAAKAGREINAIEILKLCQWVTNQPNEELPAAIDGYDSLVDKGWQLTRDGISRFIENICQSMNEKTPRYPLAGLRELMLATVSALYKDVSNSHIIHDMTKDDPRVQDDYLMMGINSSRGQAVEAGLEYARWVANHIKTAEGNSEVIPGGFDAMPEVREMLEWQIAAKNRSIETLAVIGTHIGLINWIDQGWLAANADRIFNLEGIEGSPRLIQGWAAWNAFLVWVRPHILFYRLFKKQFAYAVSQSATVTITEKGRGQPMNHLGEHLMILYGRGQLELDEDEGLLRNFIANTQPDIRRHAISFVGDSVSGEEKIPGEVIDRFMALWEIYWNGPGKKDAEGKFDVCLFGTWFASGKFPDQWAIDQLEKFVNVNPTPEPDHEIIQQLEKICQADIAKAVRIVDLMARGDKEGWRTYTWKNEARQILEKAMKAGGEARIQGERVIDYLGRRGYTDFGDLLSLRGMNE